MKKESFNKYFEISEQDELYIVYEYNDGSVSRMLLRDVTLSELYYMIIEYYDTEYLDYYEEIMEE